MSLDAPPVSARSRRRAVLAAVIIAGVLGVLAVQGLGNATLYFRTADEAVAQRDELGQKRLRIEGTVVPGSIEGEGTATAFRIASRGVSVPVRNTAQPLGIFREDIPVVLEGRFAEGSATFESDRIMVRHDNEYVEQYPERLTPDPSASVSPTPAA